MAYKDAENFRISAMCPNVADFPVTRTSEATRNYNCYAYAAGDTKRPWYPLPVLPKNVYWPPGCPRREDDLWSIILGYATLGYEICGDGKLEEGVEKIAIYVMEADVPKHVAIQRATGEWQSKLGSDIDVCHTLESLEDAAPGKPSIYGKAKYFMRRPRVG